MKKLSVYHNLSSVIVFIVITWGFIPFRLSAQYNENIMKAAYIERLTRFIDWPYEDTGRDSTLFIIGVYGDNQFLGSLREVLKDKTIKNHPVVFKNLSSPSEVTLCDMVYVSTSDVKIVLNIITLANNKGVLVLSGSKGFGEKGTHINFFIENNKLKFEINRKSIETGRFKISSLLLNNAKII